MEDQQGAGWIAAMVMSTGALLAIFFGRPHWQMLRELVHEQQVRIDHLEGEVKNLRAELEKWRRAYQTAVSEVRVRDSTIDSYTETIKRLGGGTK
jgi:peptidoglycan hydrolase CwlO-like protein